MKTVRGRKLLFFFFFFFFNFFYVCLFKLIFFYKNFFFKIFFFFFFFFFGNIDLDMYLCAIEMQPLLCRVLYEENGAGEPFYFFRNY